MVLRDKRSYPTLLPVMPLHRSSTATWRFADFLIIAALLLAASFFGYQQQYRKVHAPPQPASGLAEAEQTGSDIMAEIQGPPGTVVHDIVHQSIHTGGKHKFGGTHVSVHFIGEWEAPGTPAEIHAWFREQLPLQGWKGEAPTVPTVPTDQQTTYRRDHWLLTVEPSTHSGGAKPKVRYRLRLVWDYRPV